MFGNVIIKIPYFGQLRKKRKQINLFSIQCPCGAGCLIDAIFIVTYTTFEKQQTLNQYLSYE
jgi:hypothetical protein